MARKRKPLQAAALTAAKLSNAGGIVGRVEQYNSHSGQKRDLFGIFDLIAVNAEIVGIQACSVSGLSAHRKTIFAAKASADWLDAGGRIQIWAWKRKEVATFGKTAKSATKTVIVPQVEEIIILEGIVGRTYVTECVDPEDPFR